MGYGRGKEGCGVGSIAKNVIILPKRFITSDTGKGLIKKHEMSD